MTVQVSNYPTILEGLKTLVSSGVPAASVHTYQRHVADWKALVDLFKVVTILGTPPNTSSVTTIHGWTISRSAVTEQWLTNAEVIREHEFKIRGVMGVQDSTATEDTFNDAIESISNKCRGDFSVAGACEFHEPVSWSPIDYRIFGGILCHYAEGTIRVRERLQGGA